jgi:cytochrome P450
MSNAPLVHIDMQAFWRDPYPTLATLRSQTPVAYVPELRGTVFATRDDIFSCEKNIEVFSSDQPNGLMNKLMGQNMMRKDGPAHVLERKAIMPTVSPKVVKEYWTAQFQASADRILDSLETDGTIEFCSAFALPFSGECLKSITGLTNITFHEMDAWSQAMIDGIANYVGDAKVTANCHRATESIDAAIDDILPRHAKAPNPSLLSVMLEAGLPLESIKANIKLAISGGQNEPRDAIAGTLWALLAHPEQRNLVLQGKASWLQAFEEYARWVSPVGMSPRRIAKPFSLRNVDFEVNDQIFFMYGSANRDERHFVNADAFDIQRDTSKSISFGAGPHFCAGAWASRAMIAHVALPTIFKRFANLRLTDAEAVFVGWAFRGLRELRLALS